MVKYHGGKQRDGEDIANAIYKESLKYTSLKGYCEPFAGMCGVYKHIPGLYPEKFTYLAGDVNGSVIRMWKRLQNGKWTPPSSISRKEFMELKNKPDSALRGFIGPVASYNGIFFGSFRYGNNPNDTGHFDRTVQSVKKDAKMLYPVEFCHGSYDQFSHLKNFVIYCDPPYEGSQFICNNQLIRFDNKTFYLWCEKMSKHNLVLISSYYISKSAIKVKKVWEASAPRLIKGKELPLEKLFKVVI